MEDQIGTVLHWSHQKEPKQPKRKDEVIRRNPHRIHISAATPLASNPCRHSQVSLIQEEKNSERTQNKKNQIIMAARPCVQSG